MPVARKSSASRGSRSLSSPTTSAGTSARWCRAGGPPTRAATRAPPRPRATTRRAGPTGTGSHDGREHRRLVGAVGRREPAVEPHPRPEADVGPASGRRTPGRGRGAGGSRPRPVTSRSDTRTATPSSKPWVARGSPTTTPSALTWARSAASSVTGARSSWACRSSALAATAASTSVAAPSARLRPDAGQGETGDAGPRAAGPRGQQPAAAVRPPRPRAPARASAGRCAPPLTP